MISLPIQKEQALVVFSDLDGTLIDHHTYGFERSLEAVRHLEARKVPLVFCSSKTFEEQVFIQQEMGLKLPFIFENGSAVAIPFGFFPAETYVVNRTEQEYNLVVFAHADAGVLRAELSEIPGIQGYKDTSDADLSAITGLNDSALQRARARWFTETLVTQLSADQVLQVDQRLKASGFVLSRGGRFYTAQSAAANKGKAVQWMMDLFRSTGSQMPYFAAIGDSPNDLPMLKVVDLPFLVQGPTQAWTELELPALIKMKGGGPIGFSAAIQRLLGA